MESRLCFFTFAPVIATHNLAQKMENIQNSRGKGYCLLYIFMALFFLISLILMFYSRSGVVDFPK
jgi:hypothetical protein